ncbi:MAG: HAD family hydrolase [Candidatus Dormibacteraeota bacterium]|nr:HAD family hydrolase [Candidatus Dormibacteraeota bacterium]
MPLRARLGGLLFDFDGLIVDTESPSYESWNEIYREHRHELDLAQWADVISNHDSPFDALENLRLLVGDADFDAAALAARRNARKDEITDLTELLPGIRKYVDEASGMGLKLGIASGSSRQWVTRHLERLGIDQHWDCIRCRDDVQRSKPDPETYLALLDCLGVSAEEAIALEDSPNGIASAKAAGIYVVAVPNPLTRLLDLSDADLVVESLADLPLDELLRRAGR